MRFGPREIIFMVALMVIPIGAWWFVFRPQNTRNAEMRRQIEARQAKLRDLNTTLSAIGDLEEEIGSLNKAIEFFHSRLPSEKEIHKILQEIWLLAESNDLDAKSIRTLTSKGAKGYLPKGASQAEQLIGIELEGDFRGFYAFLLALEDQPRIMRISKMDLELVDKDETGKIKAAFELSIFFERDGKGESWAQKSST